MQMSMTCTQRVIFQQRAVLTLEVMSFIIETIITPCGDCPECGYKMDEDEICAGWRDDPLDFTTLCPECKHRFIAHLHTKNQRTGELDSFEYLCLDQLFWRLRSLADRKERELLGKVFLHKNDLCALFNMIRHFGTYERGRAVYSTWLESRA